MRENTDPREARTDGQAARPEGVARGQDAAPSDREVPLPEEHMPEVIQAWLDGEKVNEEQLRAAEHDYKFWRRVEEETGKRRRLKTPSSLPGEIMRAIKKDP